ncbi:hypothetical protein JCM6882_008572 [Rhodosporidiobolus microsporus]
MLETVRSRQIYGFGVLTLIPACLVAGYYLRTRSDDRIATAAHAAASQPSSTSQLPTSVDERAVRERIEMLKRREAELDDEAKELRTKLDRAKGREGHKGGAGAKVDAYPSPPLSDPDSNGADVDGKEESLSVADLPTYTDAVSSAPAVLFHVYRDGSVFNRNEIVTGADKEKILYHYEVPYTLSGSWSFCLRRGGPQGPEVASFHKAHAFSGGGFGISWADRSGDVLCARDGHFSAPYTFRLGTKEDGESYAWSPDGLLMKKFDYTLYKASDLDRPATERKPVAHLRLPKWTYAWSKQSALTISPDLAHEQEAILATALGVGIRSRERRDWGW